MKSRTYVIRIVTQSRVLQCVAVCCSVLQCVLITRWSLAHTSLGSWLKAVCCSVLQCVAVCCSVLQCVAVCADHEMKSRAYVIRIVTRSRVLQCVCWSVLKCVAVCCSVCWSRDQVSHTLQHTATHCNWTRQTHVTWLVNVQAWHDKVWGGYG